MTPRITRIYIFKQYYLCDKKNTQICENYMRLTTRDHSLRQYEKHKKIMKKENISTG